MKYLAVADTVIGWLGWQDGDGFGVGNLRPLTATSRRLQINGHRQRTTAGNGSYIVKSLLIAVHVVVLTDLVLMAPIRALGLADL